MPLWLLTIIQLILLLLISDLKSIIESRRSESKLSKKKQEFRELRNKVETSGGKLPKYNPHIAAIAALGTDDRKKGKDALGEMNRRSIDVIVV